MLVLTSPSNSQALCTSQYRILQESALARYLSLEILLGQSEAHPEVLHFSMEDISQLLMKNAFRYLGAFLAITSMLMSQCESLQTAIQHVGEHLYYISPVPKVLPATELKLENPDYRDFG